MVNTIRINGSTIYNRETVREVIEKQIEEAKGQLEEVSREVRRNKVYKKIMVAVTALSTLCMSSVAKAESLHSSSSIPAEAVVPYLFNKAKDKLLYDGTAPVEKHDTLLWQLNEYMSHSLFTNQDFFHNPAVVTAYHAIWGMSMSFLVLIIGKKGFDMINAHMVGAQTQNSGEFIARMLISGVLSYFALDFLSIGTNLSNLGTAKLMSLLSNGTQSFDGILGAAEAGIGATIWLISFVIMFIIVFLGYWVRQFNFAILGILAPVANLAWVTDGGSMLKGLIKEVILILSTPIVQCLVLALSTIFTIQVGTSGTIGFLNSIFIGLSTMFVMLTTPTFLRKFITGSANPLGFALKTAIQLKTMPAGLLKVFK
jgi:hypothetical protein